MKNIITKAAIYVLKVFLYSIIGATIALFTVGVKFMNDKPDLHIWHTADLDEEFTVRSKVTTFEEYLSLEDRLFTQLNELVYQRNEGGNRG